MARATDDERREVAENLRTMCAYGVRYKEQFYDLLEETVMNVEDFHEFSDVAERLADLIDPDTTTDTTKSGPDTTKAPNSHPDLGSEEVDAPRVPECDREALLALAKGLCDGYPYGLSHGGLEQLARHIREACGEAVA